MPLIDHNDFMMIRWAYPSEVFSTLYLAILKAVVSSEASPSYIIWRRQRMKSNCSGLLKIFQDRRLHRSRDGDLSIYGRYPHDDTP